ncbi:MAG: hypothetical protein HUU46_02415 [Candidatus Hydrogenedentes bacterium]|nr:hypothetical protein [Candidatus Hydrogenedentota bacterium]
MSDEQVKLTAASARIVALAILSSMCIMTGLGLAIAAGALPIGPPGMDPASGRQIGTIFLVVGISTIGLSHVMRTALDKRAATSANPAQARFRATIIGMALGETPATLALVNAILTHNVTITALLGAAAIITGLLHFPRARLVE